LAKNHGDSILLPQFENNLLLSFAPVKSPFPGGRMRISNKIIQISLVIALTACAVTEASSQTAGRPPTQPMTNSDKVSFAEAGIISGRVTYPSGEPVSTRIKITLSAIGKPAVTSYTDGKGEFSFRSLKEGTYTIEVEGDSSRYHPVKEEVRLVKPGRAFLSISLREKSNTRDTKEAVGVVEAEQQVPQEARKEFEKAARLVGEGKITDAVTHLEKAVAIFPDYLMARNNLGAQYLKLDRTNEAIEQFKEAVRINPKSYNPRLNLGLILINLDKLSEAITFLRELESIDSTRPAGYFYYGFALLKSEQIEAAEQQFRRAIEFGGNEYVVSHFYLAHVYIQKQDRDKAIEELKTFLKKAPANHQHAPQVRALLDQLEGSK
jgi:Flp pilus assembly protein TadD